MVEVGIPVWHARKTLPKALDSLVAQTKERFITCLSIDGDGENYDDIIEEYRRRGLKIRVIRSEENGGPGMARQRVFDTTQCDYVMFMDSDDMLLPRAVEILYTESKAADFDIVRSSFIREEKNKQDLYLPQNAGTITWFHGKIYKVKYIRDNNIRFLPLKTDEDAYFNLVAWNSTKKRGEISEVTYLWRFNENSLTRSNASKDYFCATYMNYITSQVEGLKSLARLGGGEVNPKLVSQTLINIYTYYMRAKFYQIPGNDMDLCLMSLKNEKWMQDFLRDLNNWVEITKNLHAGDVYDKTYVVFYSETFNVWAMRLLKA